MKVPHAWVDEIKLVEEDFPLVVLSDGDSKNRDCMVNVWLKYFL